MNKKNKILVALLVGALGVMGMGGMAFARGGHGYHGNCPGSGGHGAGYGYRNATEINPEIRSILDKSYAETAPQYMELQAKQAELTAKIYSGADEKTIQDLSRSVNELQTRLNDSRVRLQQQLAKAGMPLNGGFGNCPMGGGGFGRGMGFHGYKNGYGYHGHGYGPCMGYSQGAAPAGAAPQN